jgi:hypothetical protein
MARAVAHQRKQEALKLLGDGWGCTELVAKLAADWGCSRRTSRRYVSAAYRELVADLEDVQASDMLASIVARLERAARKADEAGQHAVVVGACKALLEAVVIPHRDQHHHQRVRRWS